ncbi:MAG: hypothetical protein KatS3mg102_2298 [Planctomycetota bacterium]|nr:MAG: hypothetical protein KatS3mg102_2298 [Planctomycetota bacterium]
MDRPPTSAVASQAHPLTWLLDAQAGAADLSGPPVWSGALCAGFAGGRDGCSACHETCPHGALSRTADAITIDGDACQRCGACVSACPTGALQRRFLPDADIFATLERALPPEGTKPSALVLRCRHEAGGPLEGLASGGGRAVSIGAPSIHLFSEAHLLGAVGMGFRAVLLEPCERCRGERGVDHPQRVADLANRLLAAWGLDEERCRVGRSAEPETADWLAGVAALEARPWTPPQSILSRREVIADLAAHFEAVAGARGGVAAKRTDPYGEPAVDDQRCTLCGTCARVCPTGALNLSVEEGLSLRAVDCVACGLCEALCGEEAVAVSCVLPAGAASRQRRVLKQSQWHRCPDCGRTTYSRDYVARLESLLDRSSHYATPQARELLRLCEPCKGRRAIGPLLDAEAGAAGSPDGGCGAVGKSALVRLPILGSPSPQGPPAPEGAAGDAAGVSRRDFLRAAALIAAGAGFAASRAAAETGGGGTGSVAEGPGVPSWDPSLIDRNALIRMQADLGRALEKPMAQRRWVMVIDLGKCVGCHACTIACVAENQLPPGVVYRPVIEEEIGTYPNVRRRFVPRPCMQCEEPPCVPVCPVNATWKRPDGITVIDYNRCIGCRYCLTACPYSARTSDFGEFYSDGTPARQPYEELANYEYKSRWRRSGGGSPVGNARKCHFCIHRIEEGMLPACVTTCIGVATYFGDANDPQSLVSELISSSRVVRLKEEMGTRPNVYYLM